MNAKYMLAATMVIGALALAPVLKAASFSTPTFRMHTEKFITGRKFQHVGANTASRLTAFKPNAATRWCNPATFRTGKTRELMPGTANYVVRFQKSTLDIDRRFDAQARRWQQIQNKNFFKPGVWVGSTAPARREF